MFCLEGIALPSCFPFAVLTKQMSGEQTQGCPSGVCPVWDAGKGIDTNTSWAGYWVCSEFLWGNSDLLWSARPAWDARLVLPCSLCVRRLLAQALFACITCVETLLGIDQLLAMVVESSGGLDQKGMKIMHCWLLQWGVALRYTGWMLSRWNRHSLPGETGVLFLCWC